MTTVKGFEQRADGLWEVSTIRTGSWLRRDKRTFTATYLILAAGTWGSQHLLFNMRDKGALPRSFEASGRSDPDQFGVDRRRRDTEASSRTWT